VRLLVLMGPQEKSRIMKMEELKEALGKKERKGVY
jgi:hypothetical protein